MSGLAFVASAGSWLSREREYGSFFCRQPVSHWIALYSQAKIAARFASPVQIEFSSVLYLTNKIK
jgi:hypothetical protein